MGIFALDTLKDIKYEYVFSQLVVELLNYKKKLSIV